MNKTNWKKSTGELRARIKNRDYDGQKFAREQVTPSRFRIHHRRLNNVQADIAINGEQATVYYHPRSYYKLTILEAVKSLGITELIALPLISRRSTNGRSINFSQYRVRTEPGDILVLLDRQREILGRSIHVNEPLDQ